MSITVELRRLFAHMRWADDAVIHAFRGNADSESSAHASDIATDHASGIGTAARIFAHVLGAEEVWLSRMESRPARLPVWPDITMESCIAAARENADGYDAFLRNADDEVMNRLTSYTNSAGQPFETRTADILLHVAMHGSYHRGQVALLMRNAGAEPSPTDYIGFVRGVAAATTSVRS